MVAAAVHTHLGPEEGNLAAVEVVDCTVLAAVRIEDCHRRSLVVVRIQTAVVHSQIAAVHIEDLLRSHRLAVGRRSLGLHRNLAVEAVERRILVRPSCRMMDQWTQEAA